MNGNTRQLIVCGITMAILWSVLLTSALHNYAGIGIGICFAAVFTLLFRSSREKKNKRTEFFFFYCFCLYVISRMT